LLGDFAPEGIDGVPEIGEGRAARTLCLIGSAGPTLWECFIRSSEYRDGSRDPLDRFTKRALSTVAREFGLVAVFPFDGPPYHPFQKWAMRIGGYSQSPLGVLAHARYGPWVGLRAAFLSDRIVPGGNDRPGNGPCPDCTDKPCLTACPVSAISLDGGYNVAACRDHVASPGGSSCLSGCLARHACPYGADERQAPDQARFHMESFLNLA
jgi:hypothetical protein